MAPGADCCEGSDTFTTSLACASASSRRSPRAPRRLQLFRIAPPTPDVALTDLLGGTSRSGFQDPLILARGGPASVTGSAQRIPGARHAQHPPTRAAFLPRAAALREGVGYAGHRARDCLLAVEAWAGPHKRSAISEATRGFDAHFFYYLF